MRFFILLAFGCIAGFYSPLNSWWPASGFVLVFAVFIFVNYRITKIQDVKPWQTWLSGVLLFTIGWLVCAFYLGKHSAGFFGNSETKIIAFEAIVKQEPAAKPNVFRFSAQVIKWKDTLGKWHEAEGKILLYLFSKDLSFVPAYGDQVLIRQNPVLVQTAINPGDFDFRTFLSYQGIYYQAHVPGNQVRLIRRNTGNWIVARSIEARNGAIEIIKSTISSKQEASVAMALVLGVKSFIDPELRNAYQSAGAMHVLAVSGMHVGLVFGALTLIFGFLKQKKQGIWAFTCIILSILWAYSLVTGFSASVLRAVTMSSFVLLANSMGKHYNMFNILGIAGFVLLLFQPTVVFDVGFQLSFAAVFGIFLIYPASGYLVQTGNKIIDSVWKVSCVAFAAQLFTFPLSMYYFNQFPNYFLLSNLAIVPTSTLAMYSSLANLCLSWVPGINILCSKLTEYSIWLMNKCIFITESLPHATTRFLYINLVETIWIYACLALLLVAVFTRRKGFLLCCLVAVGLYSGGRLIRNLLIHSRESAIVYRIPGHTLVGYFKGAKGKFVGNKELIENKSKLHYHIDRHIAMLGLSDIEFQALPDSQTHIFKQNMGAKSILVVNHISRKALKLSRPIQADFVLFRSLPHAKKMDWLNEIQSNSWVIDASVLKPKNRALISNDKVWNVMRDGPYSGIFLSDTE